MTAILRTSVDVTRRAASVPACQLAATIVALALAGGLGGCDNRNNNPGMSNSSPATSSTPAPIGTASPSPTTPPPSNMPTAQPTSAGDAVRFLEQTSFGPTDATITEVMQKGPALALEEQFTKPMSSYGPRGDGTFDFIDPDPNKGCPSGSAATCFRDNYTVFPLQVTFFRNAVSASDQLRQRVAFALSQILVISGAQLETMHGIGFYQQMLKNFAFDNYRDLLFEATLSPAMGEYLNMVNNPKPDPARKIQPNENYARELMQLFSVGLELLNPDGTRQLDSQGNPIPTYTQDDVVNLARTFTGWTYPAQGSNPSQPGVAAKFPSPKNYLGMMASFEAQHDTSAKTVLGSAIPAGQTALKDLNDALNIIFNHPNVGPFIGRQLIQQLVTSNPSPAYVARVTAAFNNNGQGVRGDMRAVLRAILLDAEARGDVKTAADFGKLREPALYVAGLIRALGGASDGVFLASQATSMGQDVFDAPSVFNFYPPDYVAPGSTIAGPPFKIMLTGTILNRSNYVNRVVFGGNVGPDTSVAGSTGTRINLQPLQALAGNAAQLGPLLDRLNLVFMHNALSPQAQQVIQTATQAATTNTSRAQQAVYLIATAAQYQVEQ